jgi:hypothetical protein
MSQVVHAARQWRRRDTHRRERLRRHPVIAVSSFRAAAIRSSRYSARSTRWIPLAHFWLASIRTRGIGISPTANFWNNLFTRRCQKQSWHTCSTGMAALPSYYCAIRRIAVFIHGLQSQSLRSSIDMPNADFSTLTIADAGFGLSRAFWVVTKSVGYPRRPVAPRVTRAGRRASCSRCRRSRSCLPLMLEIELR